jgi:hypothetical protein
MSQPENDCLTVLCFKVTELTKEKIQLNNAGEQLMGKLKQAAEDAKKHNDEALKLTNDVKHVLMNLPRPADDAEVKRVLSAVDSLLEHLK